MSMKKKIEEISDAVRNGEQPTATVRELLGWFDARRRRSGVVDRIRGELSEAGITTMPDFTKTWIDSQIAFRPKPDSSPAAVDTSSDGMDDSAEVRSENGLKDGSFVVGLLEAANRGVTYVNPQSDIREAITLMLVYDYSQLAVMTGERELKGVFSWKTLGKQLSHDNSPNYVGHAMEPAAELLETEALFRATDVILDEGFAFVRSSIDKKITGIVTATDLSEQFKNLSEPFLLLGQIENRLRALLHGVFEIDELREVCDNGVPGRKDKVEGVADLNFGDYVRLMENPNNWSRIGLLVDRNIFCSELEKVRVVRNDVMHFDPDGIDDEQYDQLRRFSDFLGELQQLSTRA